MHYLLVNTSKQMSLNKIIFFLLLAVPEGQIRGTEHLPDNVQCTQIMTSGSLSLCQSWGLGHWEMCSNLCLSKSGPAFLCSGLSHLSAFQTAILALHTYRFPGSYITCGSVWQKVQVSRDGLAGSKIIIPWKQASISESRHNSAISQVEHSFNQCI